MNLIALSLIGKFRSIFNQAIINNYYDSNLLEAARGEPVEPCGLLIYKVKISSFFLLILIYLTNRIYLSYYIT